MGTSIGDQLCQYLLFQSLGNWFKGRTFFLTNPFVSLDSKTDEFGMEAPGWEISKLVVSKIHVRNPAVVWERLWKGQESIAGSVQVSMDLQVNNDDGSAWISLWDMFQV